MVNNAIGEKMQELLIFILIILIIINILIFYIINSFKNILEKLNLKIDEIGKELIKSVDNNAKNIISTLNSVTKID